MIPDKIKDKPRMTKELRDSMRDKYHHGEAFCHMLYVSDDGRQVEWLWNSRDGVTPFCISSVTGKAMNHSYFGEDRFDPDYKPEPGDRIFVDALPEMLRESAGSYVEKYWDLDIGGGMNMKNHPALGAVMTKEQVIDHFLTEWTKPGSPHVQTVEG